MTLEEKLAKARQLRAEGCNCAQCVALVSAPEGMDKEMLKKLTLGLGGGLGGAGETCAAISAASMIAALPYSDKKIAYAKVKPLVEKFREGKSGIACRDIKGHCWDWIEQAITLLHNHQNEE